MKIVHYTCLPVDGGTKAIVYQRARLVTDYKIDMEKNHVDAVVKWDYIEGAEVHNICYHRPTQHVYPDFGPSTHEVLPLREAGPKEGVYPFLLGLSEQSI
jgi:hypothetical protein